MNINLKLSAPLRYGLLINLWLLLMVLGTALLLVRWQYTSRSLFIALEKSENTGKQLAINNASALAEKRQLASPTRVERTASQNLGMKTVDPSVTVYLSKP
jgi:cell division protein FtsL